MSKVTQFNKSKQDTSRSSNKNPATLQLNDLPVSAADFCLPLALAVTQLKPKEAKDRSNCAGGKTFYEEYATKVASSFHSCSTSAVSMDGICDYGVMSMEGIS